jgi:UDP-N-acetyl-D-mannosaminuronic acid dehydrogenase
MDQESSLVKRIRVRKANVGIIGLGRVGLPTALVFAQAGFRVKGVDIDRNKVNILQRGISYLSEPGIQNILKACLDKGTFSVTSDMFETVHTSDIVSICVPTPVENSVPDLTKFEAAFEVVKRGARSNLVVLIESTLPPSTTLAYAVPELESLGYRIDCDIFLAYCPERLAPRLALKEFQNTTRIVGQVGPRSGRIAKEFYRTVCKKVILTDALTAEISKVAENTFRDLNIAYANLLALLCERFGSDALKVIALANTHPRVSIHRPGFGVGGPCLPKDPFLLTHGAPLDIVELVRQSRKLNDYMPRHALEVLSEVSIRNGRAIKNTKIAVLGVAYKEDIDDVTNSPARILIEGLLGSGASVVVYDPYTQSTFGAQRAASLEQALRDADWIVIAAGHRLFRSIDSHLEKQLTRPHCAIFDGARLLNPERVKGLGYRYYGIGYGFEAHS